MTAAPSAKAVSAYIAIGSNLQNPMLQVSQAIEALAAIPNTQLVSYSSRYQSKAIGPGEQPDYINAVARLDTALTAHSLLDKLQEIEQAQHRVRHQRWGARTLDLDILLYGQQHISSERLNIPHPQLQNRNFVLIPLSELARQTDVEISLPNGTPLESLLVNCSTEGLQRLIPDNTDHEA